MSVTVKLSKTAQEIMLASYHIQKDFQLTLFLEKKTKKQKTKPSPCLDDQNIVNVCYIC